MVVEWWLGVCGRVFGSVVAYFGDRRLFLVTGGHISSIWVTFLHQTDVAARVLLLGSSA